MAKTTLELTNSIEEYVEALERQVQVSKVFLTGDYARGTASDHSDIRLVVISPSFEGKNQPERIDTLANVGVRIDPLIQAWGYTPAELEDARTGRYVIPLLGMFLHTSKEVFSGSGSRRGNRSHLNERGGHHD
jgi:predicted nucleotidyltransferase